MPWSSSLFSDLKSGRAGAGERKTEALGPIQGIFHDPSMAYGKWDSPQAKLFFWELL